MVRNEEPWEKCPYMHHQNNYSKEIVLPIDSNRESPLSCEISWEI